MHENNERSIEEKKLDILEETYEIIKKEIEAQRIDANEFFRTRILTEIIANRKAARAELEKAEYEGKTMDELEALATATDADPKYVVLWEQLLAALARDVQQRYAGISLTPRAKAAEKGALSSLRRVSSFSEETMQNALTPDCIFKLKKDGQQYSYNKNGQLNTLPFDTGSDEWIELKNIHTGFLMLVLEGVCQQTDSITFYIPDICKKCHFDPRGFSSTREKGISLPELQTEKVLSLIAQFEAFIGRATDGKFYRVLTLQEYDPESRTVTISAPYLKKQHEIALAKELNHSPFNHLFHASAVGTRSQVALEVANRIICGVQRLGLKRAPYTISCEQLIEACPQLRNELNQIKAEKDKNWRQKYNTRLKQVFETAFKLILKHSDAPLYYENFDYGPKNKQGKILAPTVSTIKKKIFITHTGKSKTYDPG